MSIFGEITHVFRVIYKCKIPNIFRVVLEHLGEIILDIDDETVKQTREAFRTQGH